MIISIFINAELRFKKINFSLYWVVCVVGALTLIATGCVSFKRVTGEIFSVGNMNPVKILLLFLSMTGISVFLDAAGFFEKLAVIAVKKAGKSKLKLFIYLYALVSVLTIFTSNDVIILTFTPFICYFCKAVKTNPLPLLFCEFVAGNTWSMFFIFGNPTNVYLTATSDIGFGEYFLNMAIPTLVCGVVSFTALIGAFYADLKTPLEKKELVRHGETDKTLVVMGLVALFCSVVMMAVADLIEIEMQNVTLISFITLILCALIYLKFNGKGTAVVKNTLKRLPFALVPFLLSMFVIVSALDASGYVEKTGDFLNSFQNGTVAYGIASFLSCNVINNIPMSVLFKKILSGSAVGGGAVYATVLGSNLGALLTPTGALAGIMWMNLSKRYKANVGFLTFFKYGLMISMPTLLATIAII